MFVYTLPVIFIHTSLITPIGLIIIILGLYCILHLSAPVPDDTWRDYPLKQIDLSYIYDGWYGEIALWKVFWPYFLILNTGLYITDYQAIGAAISVSSWDTIQMLFFISSIWWYVAVWRTSEKTGQRIWCALARTATFCAMFDFSLRVLIRVGYPRIFFNCQDVLVNMWSCF